MLCHGFKIRYTWHIIHSIWIPTFARISTMCPTGDILFPIRSASWTPVNFFIYMPSILTKVPEIFTPALGPRVILVLWSLHEECSKSAWLIHVHSAMSAAWGENDMSLSTLTHSPDQYCSADVDSHLIVLHRASPAVPCKNISHIQVYIFTFCNPTHQTKTGTSNVI
jgi:hypothetical protein